MAHDELMAEVDQRTNLAMSNEMEMLTFYLTDKQLYGLNVFKIIEILETPKRVTKIPHAHATIKGEINFRGRSISMIDLAEYLGLQPVDYKNEVSYVLVCEYSTTTQGFLISQPNLLITKSWDDIIKPDGTVYNSSCLTAFVYHDGEAIQMLANSGDTHLIQVLKSGCHPSLGPGRQPAPLSRAVPYPRFIPSAFLCS